MIQETATRNTSLLKTYNVCICVQYIITYTIKRFLVIGLSIHIMYTAALVTVIVKPLIVR